MTKNTLGSFSVLALAAFLFTAQTSCTKETDNDPKTDCRPSIQGLWTGSWVNSGQPASAAQNQTFSWSIKPDGTASYENVMEGVQQLCVGTWTLVNGTWTCNTTCMYGAPGNVGTKQTFTATYDAITGKLTNGAFVNATVEGHTGTFTITEVN